MQDWVNLISSVGFPIVCCFMLWQYMKTTMKDFQAKIDKNTEIMTRLYERIETLCFGDNNDKEDISHK